MTLDEEFAGRKADYRVYYRKNGKPKVFFDAMWASSPEEAKARPSLGGRGLIARRRQRHCSQRCTVSLRPLP